MGENSEHLDEETLSLVSRAKKGDARAMGNLYELYENRLKGAVRKKLGHKLRERVETMDLVQSVWKDVLSDMKGFDYRGSDSFFKWLLSCTLRKIQDKGRYFKADKRNIEKETDLYNGKPKPDDRHQPKCSDPTPSQMAMKDEHMERLMGFLDRLPDSQRQALVLHMKDELPFDKIAEIMGKSPDAVRKLYSRAVKTIGEIMLKERQTEDDSK